MLLMWICLISVQLRLGTSFVLLLNFVDLIKSIITLTQSELKTTEEDDIDFALYIKKSYDPVDGMSIGIELRFY